MAAILLGWTVTAGAAQPVSPNGKLTVETKGHGLVVFYQKQPVLEVPSVEGADVPLQLQFTQRVTADYQMVTGKRLHCTNEANEYRSGNLQLRVYNDGIAFRTTTTDKVNDSRQTIYRIPEGTRSRHPVPAEGSIEDSILATLGEHGSLITHELRAACGFDGPKMRSKFDGYVTRLQMGCYIVTEDFVYPTDKHGREYGWGWSLLTTPEALLGREACRCERTPQESYQRMLAHFRALLPEATEKQIKKLIG